MRYLIRLAYNGTAYHGWQKQENAHAVQTEIELKLSLLLGENTECLGCGRTDTGVHALVYFAHFDFPQELDCSRLMYKMNQVLPDDISIHDIHPVNDQFNARFDASYREYEYRITRIRDPFQNDTAWFHYGKLDVSMMNEAAGYLITQKDFECFSKVHTQVNNFICDVQFARWEEKGHMLVFTIRANRFLRNMVRAIVGTLLDVGRNKISLEEFRQITESKDRREAGQSVPAHGLFLTAIHYPESKLTV